MFGEIVKNLFKKQDVKESQEVVTRTYNIKFSQFENLESFRKVPVFEIHITPQSKLTIGREMFEDLYTSISDEVKKAIGKIHRSKYKSNNTDGFFYPARIEDGKINTNLNKVINSDDSGKNTYKLHPIKIDSAVVFHFFNLNSGDVLLLYNSDRIIVAKLVINMYENLPFIPIIIGGSDKLTSV